MKRAALSTSFHRKIQNVPARLTLSWFIVVYTERGNTMRVISLRKANQREFDDYERHQA
jgi:uncharacterized DUF497 family protein